MALFLILLGLAFLFDVSLWRLFWPLLIIIIGIRMLIPRGYYNWQSRREEVREDTLDYSAVFSGLDKKIVTKDFKGGKVNVVFGGGTLDLSEAQIAKNGTAKLEVNAVFGGIKIIVPRTWNVNSSLVGVFGGFNNATELPEEKAQTGRLLLKGAAVFGGGEVVNK